MHTYLGIFRIDPLGVVAVAPERTLFFIFYFLFFLKSEIYSAVLDRSPHA